MSDQEGGASEKQPVLENVSSDGVPVEPEPTGHGNVSQEQVIRSMLQEMERLREEMRILQESSSTGSTSKPKKSYCKKPSIFSGNPKRLEGFIRRLRIFFDASNVPKENRILTAASYLDGSAG